MTAISRTDAVAARVREIPRQPAVVSVASGRTLTYADLWARADAYAAAVAGLGGGRGPVAVVLADPGEHAAAVLGVERAGAVLATLSPDLASEELVASLRFLETRVIVGRLTPAVLAQVPTCMGVVVDGPAAVRVSSTALPRTYEIAPRWSRLRFTSGTLARPKVAILSAEAETVHDARRRGYLQPGEALVSGLEIGHDFTVFPALADGGIYVSAPARSPRALAKIVASHRATAVIAVPWVFRQWARHPETHDQLRSLRFGLKVGPLPMEILRSLYRDVGFIPLNRYGSSETGGVMQPPTVWVEGKMDTVGRPYPGLQVRLATEDGREAAVDEPGELWVRGPGLMEGYLKDAARTAQAFSDGWYRTGDLLTRDRDGYFRVVGRVKAMISVAGRKVHPEEVEQVLLEHPAVDGAAVVAGADRVRGERVEAFIVPLRGSSITAEELRAFCHARLTAYKVPRRYAFVDALPSTRFGSVARGRLAAMAQGAGEVER